LAVELIKLVDVAIRVGAVAFTGAVIIQTDIGILNSGNMSNKGSHGSPFTGGHSERRQVGVGGEHADVVREGVALMREPIRGLRSAVLNLVA
jgi:hypothetical protein